MKLYRLLLVINLILLTAFTTPETSALGHGGKKICEAVAEPQCVICYRGRLPNGGWDCWLCMAGTSDAKFCRTPRCSSCNSWGACRAIIEKASAVQLKANMNFRVDDATIRQVAQVQPRFAVALAEININGWSDYKETIRYNTVAVPLSAQDVEFWLLNPEDPRAVQFFAEYDKIAAQTEAIATYNITIRESGDTVHISLSVSGSLPSVDSSLTVMTIAFIRSGNEWISNQLSIQ